MQLKGLPAYLHIDKFHLEKQCGQHSRFVFQASIKPESKYAYSASVNKPIGVILQEQAVFFGIVQEVQIKESFSKLMVEVLAVSESVLEDEKSYKRIFQAEKHSYGDILSREKLKLEKCQLEVDNAVASKIYKNISVQNEETNFAFIKRLAMQANSKLWIKDTFEGKTTLRIGKNVTDSVCSFKNADIIYSTVKNTRSTNSYAITSRKIANIGQMARIEGDGKNYLITGWQADFVREDYEFTYELTEAKAKEEEASSFLEQSIEFSAKVKSQDDPEHKGRLQVLFAEDDGWEDVEKAKPRWLPFVSPYTGKEGGIVFLPDAGDTVSVSYQQGVCLVMATKRENKLAEECSKPKEKYIGNNFQQRIFWKEKSLELLSAENKVYMDKDKIELTVDKNKIIMDKEQILLTAGKGKLLLNKDGITFEGGSSKERLSANGVEVSGSKVNINADGNVDIAGSKINLT